MSNSTDPALLNTTTIYDDILAVIDQIVESNGTITPTEIAADAVAVVAFIIGLIHPGSIMTVNEREITIVASLAVLAVISVVRTAVVHSTQKAKVTIFNHAVAARSVAAQLPTRAYAPPPSIDPTV